MAPELIGCRLVSLLGGVRTSGRIVEAEAYTGPSDAASHTARLKQGRVLTMWGPPGCIYVYRSYGIHPMMNVVCEPEGVAGAVLVRALEPCEGLETMAARRGVEDVRRLCKGPGTLTIALGITLDDHGRDLVTDPELWIEAATERVPVSAGPRIGISKAVDEPWRFFETGSRFVSAHRRGHPLIETDS